MKLVKKDAIEYIRQLKNQDGKDIWLCGGGDLAGKLANEGLIDELILKVNPIAIGKGIGIFENLKETIAMNLTSSKNYSNGVVLLKYKLKVKQ